MVDEYGCPVAFAQSTVARAYNSFLQAIDLLKDYSFETQAGMAHRQFAGDKTVVSVPRGNKPDHALLHDAMKAREGELVETMVDEYGWFADRVN